VQIAEAKVRRGDIEYTIPVDMSRCVGQQIRIAMLAITHSDKTDGWVSAEPNIETPSDTIMNLIDNGIERFIKGNRDTAKIHAAAGELAREYRRCKERQNEIRISGEDKEALKHWQRDVDEWGRSIKASQSCGVWVCNVGEPCDVECG